MSVTSSPFHTLFAQLYAGNVNYQATGGHTIKMALFTTAPSLTTALYSSLTGEVAAGGGYTTGGAALSSISVTETEANSWGTPWSATTWAAGSIVIPSVGNGYLYVTPNGGTSTGSAPTWPTVVGETVTDGGGVIWENVGADVTTISAGSVSWTSSTITASYAVIYDSSTSVNIVLINFGGSQSDSSGTFTVAPSTTGWVANFGN